MSDDLPPPPRRDPRSKPPRDRGVPRGREIDPRATPGGDEDGIPPTPRSGSSSAPQRRSEPGRTLPRHVWVLTEARAGRLPGVLVQWRHEPAGNGAWVGLVAYAGQIDGRPGVVNAWLPAERLRPAGDGAQDATA